MSFLNQCQTLEGDLSLEIENLNDQACNSVRRVLIVKQSAIQKMVRMRNSKVFEGLTSSDLLHLEITRLITLHDGVSGPESLEKRMEINLKLAALMNLNAFEYMDDEGIHIASRLMGPVSERMEYFDFESLSEEEDSAEKLQENSNIIPEAAHDKPFVISILALPTKSELKDAIKNFSPKLSPQLTPQLSPQSAFNEDSLLFDLDENVSNGHIENIRDIYYDSSSPTSQKQIVNIPTNIHIDEPDPTPSPNFFVLGLGLLAGAFFYNLKLQKKRHE